MPKDDGTVTLTVDALKDFGEAIGNAIAAKIGDVSQVSADAAAKAHLSVQGGAPIPDDRKSVFNPKGDREHPRPQLARETWFCGYRLQWEELTRDELEALNRIKPGVYHDGRWKVEERTPGMPNGPLMISLAEIGDKDQRASLPSLLAIARELAGDVATPVGG